MSGALLTQPLAQQDQAAFEIGLDRRQAEPHVEPRFENSVRPVRCDSLNDDLKAVYAYPRTIQPVTNHVPDYRPPAEATTSEAR